MMQRQTHDHQRRWTDSAAFGSVVKGRRLPSALWR
jgi:hypothetical protein